MPLYRTSYSCPYAEAEKSINKYAGLIPIAVIALLLVIELALGLRGH